MELLIFIALLIVPVKIAATLVGAERTGYLYSTFAILGVISFELARYNYFPQLNFWGISFFTGPVIYMLVLGTNYIRALGITVIQIVIMVSVMLLLNVIYPDLGLEFSINI